MITNMISDSQIDSESYIRLVDYITAVEEDKTDIILQYEKENNIFDDPKNRLAIARNLSDGLGYIFMDITEEKSDNKLKILQDIRLKQLDDIKMRYIKKLLELNLTSEEHNILIKEYEQDESDNDDEYVIVE